MTPAECPTCKHQFPVPLEVLRSGDVRVKCPACGQRFVITIQFRKQVKEAI